MPRPNVLPDIEWPAVFSDALDFDSWLAKGEKPKHQDQMRETRKDFKVGTHVEAWLKRMDRNVHVLVVAEDWCPDVVRHVPILQYMADVSGRVTVRYLLRADKPEVWARFLTNGTEAVPKFGFFNHDYVQCALWGPMPEACQELIRRGRAAGDLKKAREHVMALYMADPNRRLVVEELLRCFDTALAESP